MLNNAGANYFSSFYYNLHSDCAASAPHNRTDDNLQPSVFFVSLPV